MWFSHVFDANIREVEVGPQANPQQHRLRVNKTHSLGHPTIVCSHSCSRFLGCTFMFHILYSTISQRYCAGFRFGEFGCHSSTVKSCFQHFVCSVACVLLGTQCCPHSYTKIRPICYYNANYIHGCNLTIQMSQQQTSQCLNFCCQVLFSSCKLLDPFPVLSWQDRHLVSSFVWAHLLEGWKVC